MYGTQTVTETPSFDRLFENDVKMYGTQTIAMMAMLWAQFENDVKMYGTQTVSEYFAPFICLRMM